MANSFCYYAIANVRLYKAIRLTAYRKDYNASRMPHLLSALDAVLSQVVVQYTILYMHIGIYYASKHIICGAVHDPVYAYRHILCI
jgi:hypothetical protein